MLIQFEHTHYSGIELRGQSLLLQLKTGGEKLLKEGIIEAAVTIQQNILHIAAFQAKEYAWYYRGEQELEQTRLEVGPAASNPRLIVAGGGCHLFYFTKQSPGQSVLLRHRSLAEDGGQPMLVSTNVFEEKTSYTAAWHDNYLHVVYLSHKGQQLLYRVFDLEHGIWSGAVPFSDAGCSHPQFVGNGELYLFWLENKEKTVLQVKQKNKTWSKAIPLSAPDKHGGIPAFRFQAGTGYVIWNEGEEFYQAPFGKWSEKQELDREDLTYSLVVQGGLILPVYAEKRPEVKKEPAQAIKMEQGEIKEQKEAKLAQKRSEEAKIQAAFVESAFRTLQEWEQFKREIKTWQLQFTPPKPVEPVDLTPLLNRCDRLERRIFNLQQEQEKAKKLTGEIQALRQELGSMKYRLGVLEEKEERRRPSLWQRVLSRI